MKSSGKKLLALITAGSFILFLALIFGFATRVGNAAVAVDGATTFKTKCAACHALDGSGTTAFGKANKLRDLRSEEVQSQSDEQLTQIIGKGKGKMPGYEKSLGGEEVKAQVAYLRTLKP
ncbi:MAG: cytochrome c [Acidobacteria bacterium]|nr:cytochrome c [Acidobacteriota bacterium]